MYYVGCAGWSLRKDFADAFPAEGSHLIRYAARLPAVEINSSFYRPHRPTTYEKWAASVPTGFRFSVKVPKWITHERQLKIEATELKAFLWQVERLGAALGCLLVQLPASVKFDPAVAVKFFGHLRAATASRIACEPRHPSWFDTGTSELLASVGVARVAADPAIVAAAADPGGTDHFSYFRLHGSPRMYYSVYSDSYLEQLATRLQTGQTQCLETWCIFDNTAECGALSNALALLRLLKPLSNTV
jgi:uncharacterized protein YecE (DUF72 family)